MLLFNPQHGHIVNYDIRNLNVSRLDSDNGPLMVVDMNYPEFKSVAAAYQGPWRDSAGGFGHGQPNAGNYYNPSWTLEYSSYIQNLDQQNHFIGNITTIKHYSWESKFGGGGNQSYLHTHHLGGLPFYVYLQYIGGGNYNVNNAAPQHTIWKVDNIKGDLSQFHRFSTDSASWNQAENTLFYESLPYKAYFRNGSYPANAINKVVDTEFINYQGTGQNALVLETSDPIYSTIAHVGRIHKAQNPTFGGWPGFNSSYGRSSISQIGIIDSDFLNVGPADDWRISLPSGSGSTIVPTNEAKKLRIQQPETSVGSGSSRKVFILVNGCYDDNTFQDKNYGQGTILSCTIPSIVPNSITCDSAQYHFNLKNHPGRTQTDFEKYQTVYSSIAAFDVSADGKILTVLADTFSGGDSLLNFRMTTPWDLSTVEPWDWYDSGAAATGALGSRSPAGETLSFGSENSLNIPYRQIYNSADSATTYNVNNIADPKGMTGIRKPNEVDFTHWELNYPGQDSGNIAGGAGTYQRGVGNGINDICWNYDGSLLYVVGDHGAVVQYDCSQLRDSSYHRNVGGNPVNPARSNTFADSLGNTGVLGYYGRP